MTIKSRDRKTDVKMVRKGIQVDISCPFCEIPHPIGLTPSPCGTKLEVKAVQKVYTGATCAMCNKTGGNMIMVGTLYAHTPSCTPNKALFSKPPKMTLSAKIAHHLPDSVTKFMYKKFGITTYEVSNPKTKEVVGYSWVRMPKG